MTVFIVTIRLKHLKQHNPKCKLTGVCRHGTGQCTDFTGEHHSFLHVASKCLARKKSKYLIIFISILSIIRIKYIKLVVQYKQIKFTFRQFFSI